MYYLRSFLVSCKPCIQYCAKRRGLIFHAPGIFINMLSCLPKCSLPRAIQLFNVLTRTKWTSHLQFSDQCGSVHAYMGVMRCKLEMPTQNLSPIFLQYFLAEIRLMCNAALIRTHSDAALKTPNILSRNFIKSEWRGLKIVQSN